MEYSIDFIYYVFKINKEMIENMLIFSFYPIEFQKYDYHFEYSFNISQEVLNYDYEQIKEYYDKRMNLLLVDLKNDNKKKEELKNKLDNINKISKDYI